MALMYWDKCLYIPSSVSLNEIKIWEYPQWENQHIVSVDITPNIYALVNVNKDGHDIHFF